MNLDRFVRNLIDLVSNLDPRAAILVFAVCAIGEIGIVFPYVLESIWLITGYSLGTGRLPFWEMVGLWVIAQIGRQIGSFALYWIALAANKQLMRFYHWIERPWLFLKIHISADKIHRVNILTPFSVALGRMMGLRIPVTLALAAKKDWKTLTKGTVLSSFVFDAVYIFIGMVVGKAARPQPLTMFIYSVCGLTIIYLLIFFIRRLIKASHEDIGIPPVNTIE